MVYQPPLPIYTGTVPGKLDPNQPSRVLHDTENSLSFAIYDAHTARNDLDDSQMPDLDNPSVRDELCKGRRIVIETTPSGDSTWRYVPRAHLLHGVQDEGIFPRLVIYCGYVSFLSSLLSIACLTLDETAFASYFLKTNGTSTNWTRHLLARSIPNLSLQLLLSNTPDPPGHVLAPMRMPRTLGPLRDCTLPRITTTVEEALRPRHRNDTIPALDRIHRRKKSLIQRRNNTRPRWRTM
jgi:hypothetical protein